ncbi:ATP-binding protein [Poseidonibacter lekithochrous]|uniref:ATP-binding protein n=1 Tax=Poseidonibacter lekithochrous TaxID=1904463 RepID=UPI000D397827|nr:ATP-binding protein [Poseidonibacter lekithochrous]
MKNIKYPLLVIYIFICFIVLSLINLHSNKLIDTELENSIKDLKLHYNITTYHNKKSAEFIFLEIRKNKKIIEILGKALNASPSELVILRKELYSILSHRFETMKTKGIKILTFATPDNKTFLRVHKEDKFEDDLSSIREGIVLVNKTKRKSYGFEQGKISHAFRNIYPIFNSKNEYLGCVDIGFDSEHIQKTITDVNKMHSHFLVNKTIVDRSIWKDEGYSSSYKQSIEHKDFFISEVKDVNHVKIDISKRTIDKRQDFINSKIANAKEFAIYGLEDDDLIVISFIPISNILKSTKSAAYIVSYTYNPQIVKIIKLTQIINVIAFILMVIVLYLINKQNGHKEELSVEVDKKTKELKELNENLEAKIEYETTRNRQKDKQIYDHAKNAQMGEMIGNIAHQWRQPLSLISTVASGLKLKIEFDLFEKKDAIKELESLNNTAQHLSETIDIFRDYIKNEKKLEKVILQDRLDYALAIVGPSLNSKHIKLINKIDYEDRINIEIVVGELSQVLINIFNNAKDVLDEKEIKDKWVKISIKKSEKVVTIYIEDNAGGIKDDVLPKIFDPYFTTKHQSQGTGIGLYMSAQIVEKHLHGSLYAKNSDNGAVFVIEIPHNN